MNAHKIVRLKAGEAVSRLKAEYAKLASKERVAKLSAQEWQRYDELFAFICIIDAEIEKGE